MNWNWGCELGDMDRKAALEALQSEAIRKCQESCARKWDHTAECQARFKELYEQKKARAS